MIHANRATKTYLIVHTVFKVLNEVWPLFRIAIKLIAGKSLVSNSLCNSNDVGSILFTSWIIDSSPSIRLSINASIGSLPGISVSFGLFVGVHWVVKRCRISLFIFFIFWFQRGWTQRGFMAVLVKMPSGILRYKIGSTWSYYYVWFDRLFFSIYLFLILLGKFQATFVFIKFF